MLDSSVYSAIQRGQLRLQVGQWLSFGSFTSRFISVKDDVFDLVHPKRGTVNNDDFRFRCGKSIKLRNVEAYASFHANDPKSYITVKDLSIPSQAVDGYTLESFDGKYVYLSCHETGKSFKWKLYHFNKNEVFEIVKYDDKRRRDELGLFVDLVLLPCHSVSKPLKEIETEWYYCTIRERAIIPSVVVDDDTDKEYSVDDILSYEIGSLRDCTHREYVGSTIKICSVTVTLRGAK